MYLKLLIALIFFTFVIKKYFLKLKLYPSLNLYLKSVDKIKYLQNHNYEPQEILNNISSSGFILLIKLGLFLSPYTIIIYLLQKDFELNFFFLTLIPLLPYLVIIKERIK